MKHKKSEKGQAIVLIALAMIGLIGLTGLTVDGGMAFADRRRAQNAADASALGGGLANATGKDITSAAKAIATTNGFTENGTTTRVSVSVVNTPADGCEDDNGVNKDITVTITSTANTYFAPIIGMRTVTNTVSATARACGTYVAPIFDGNAIVGLNGNLTDGGNTPCGLDNSSGSTIWNVTGGGLFTNGCAGGGNIDLNLEDGRCLSAVGGVDGADFEGEECPTPATAYDNDYVDSIMPPNPCDGDANDEGLDQSLGVINTATNPDTITFSDGVYCITDFDDLDGYKVILQGATLYVPQQNFDVQYTGGPGGQGFSGYPTEAGDFSSYFMVIEPPVTKCTKFTQNNTQVLRFIGNGDAQLSGTVLAPGACIDFRGNTGGTINGQVIGYTVSTNGNATVNINHVDAEVRRQAVYPTIQLIK